MGGSAYKTGVVKSAILDQLQPCVVALRQHSKLLLCFKNLDE